MYLEVFVHVKKIVCNFPPKNLTLKSKCKIFVTAWARDVAIFWMDT